MGEEFRKTLDEIYEEIDALSLKRKTYVFVGQVKNGMYLRSVNMKHGCFPGDILYCGFTNRQLKKIKEYMVIKYGGRIFINDKPKGFLQVVFL